MKKLKKKIILGTANLGSYYGINHSHLVKNNSFTKIFLKIKKRKIFFIDTAMSYKNSENYLAKNNLSKFKIISKVSLIKSNSNSKIDKQILVKIENSLSKLKIKKFYGLLIHNTKELRGNKGKQIYNSLKVLKKKGLVSKIGYSIYTPGELDKFFKRFKPDIIQGPLNLFDHRIINSGWLKKLNKSGVEFHARSIFLQGLLLRNFKKIPLKFKRYNNIFRNYHKWLDTNNLSPLAACLNFVVLNKYVKKIIVGVDNSNQLEDIINLKVNTKNNYDFHKLNCLNKKIIDPSKW